MAAPTATLALAIRPANRENFQAFTGIDQGPVFVGEKGASREICRLTETGFYQPFDLGAP
jgi:hypothetical protein